MKKLFLSMMMIMTLIIICGPTLLAQEQGCHLEGNHCEGPCGTWYWGVDQQNQQPKMAGTPDCRKLKISEEHGKPIFDCHCFLLVTATRCREHVCNDDGCPNVYRSVGEAMRGENPIYGTCISQGTGNNPNCVCKYEYPKAPE